MSIQPITQSEADDVYGHCFSTTWSPPTGEPTATIILVHGLAEHAGRYQRTGSLLAEAGFRVVAPDLYGFGQSGGDRGYVEEWGHYWDQIEVFVVNAKKNGAVVLMGHSMGGLLCAGYLAEQRPTPDLAILSAPALGGGAWWQKKAAPIVARLAPKMMIPNGLNAEQLSRDPDVGEAYFADPLMVLSTAGKLGAALFSAQEHVLANLDKIDTPALVMHGGADTIVPARTTVVFEDLPGFERRLYPKLRHEILNEPEGPELVSEIASWINERLSA